MWRIEFTSAEFLPVLPEVCQGNPGVYGFELAWWLAQSLAARGVVTSYPQGEDWGWFIEHVSSADVEFTIGCSSMSEDGAGYEKTPIQWSIFIRPHTTLKHRITGVSHQPEVERIAQQVIAALNAMGITHVPSEA
jgi:hypothetical protein